MITSTTPQSCSGRNCPPEDRLDELIHGRLSDPESAVLTDHVGECTGCQDRLEALAVSGELSLSDSVKHLDRADPPSESAYWRAVGKVQASLTGIYTPEEGTDSHTPVERSGELKLDFLAPSETPGRLGMLSTFEIVRLVGRGGMGVVLHGFDACLERDVAVKILDPQLAGNETARQRFCREARAAAAVTHDNLVAVHQVDEDERSGLPFLVMQLIQGESLEQRLRRVGRLAPMEVARIGMQAAAGLSAAHANGLIHRDIKPGNMLIEAGTEKVKLTDFGLARAAEDMKLTKTGFVAGTPLYMAPEQARGDDIDPRADLFSLGSVMYEALAGKPPFDGKTPLAVLRRVSDDAHEPVSDLNPEVPDWLEAVIDRLLEKNPKDRFQTAAEVSEVLAAHLVLPGDEAEAGCGSSSRSILITKRRKLQICRKQLAATAAVFLLGTGAGGLAAWAFAPRTVEQIVPVAAGNGGGSPAVAAAFVGPEPIMELSSVKGAVWSLATSPNRDNVAIGTETGDIVIRSIDPKAPGLVASLSDHKGSVWSLDYTADGNRLVSASDDGTIKVWDLEARKPLFSLPVGDVRSAAVSPSGNLIAVGNRMGEVRVFDLNRQMMILEYHQNGVINGVAFSPDELTVASASTDMTVTLWEVAGNRKRVTLTGHNGPVYGVAFSSDGDRLATGGWDGKVIVWDVNDGTKLRSFDAHEDGVWAVQFTPCGQFLATAGQDGTAKLWDTNDGKNLARFAGHRGTVHSADFGPHGTVLVTGGRDGKTKVWDTMPYLHCDPPKKK